MKSSTLLLTQRSVCSFHHAQGRATVRFVWWPWVQGSKKDKESKDKKRRMQFCSQHTRRTQQVSSHTGHTYNRPFVLFYRFSTHIGSWKVGKHLAWKQTSTHTHVRWWVATINCKLNCTENHKFQPIWVCFSCFFSSFFACDVKYQEELNGVFWGSFLLEIHLAIYENDATSLFVCMQTNRLWWCISISIW